jgi:NAD(P)-dependent dehydrogenase (short-subunit alcohol dehydrogenase family)
VASQGSRPRTAIVTGANSGVGFFTARDLAELGLHVVLACRDHSRGGSALRRIRSELPDAQVELGLLDLADLASVRAFAGRYAADHDGLDVLVNNAGVMAVPHRRTTVQGFELQFGTNHLGHFALTGLLLGLLAGRDGSRVVTVTSVVHRRASVDLGDLQAERGYSPWKAYGASKLANLLFALELDRRLEAWDMASPISVAAHPGFAATNLLRSGPSLGRPSPKAWALRTAAPFAAQSAPAGALPLVYAATDPGVKGGGLYGPAGPGELRGHPARVAPALRALDEDVARGLWEVSEELTGVRFSPPATRP